MQNCAFPGRAPVALREDLYRVVRFSMDVE
jgi:hypothetical protein